MSGLESDRRITLKASLVKAEAINDKVRVPHDGLFALVTLNGNLLGDRCGRCPYGDCEIEVAL